MRLSSFLVATLPLLRVVVARPTSDTLHDHSHTVDQALPGGWFQDEDHEVHTLFRRAPTDGVDYPPVGSPAWSAPFPRSTPDPANLPPEWIARLNTAIQQGRIPNIPQSTGPQDTSPVYPPGVNPNSPQVCSATYKCQAPEDFWNAPDGVFASSFDDGPLPTSIKLIDFLNSQHVTTTHFMIGVNILNNPQQFLHAFNSGHDIAVHTWTHPYMTKLSNFDILGQLGWTMEIIHRSTGGRVPRYWRPPYGDADNRVRAIAKEVFGLETVIWNFDTRDWTSNLPSIQQNLTAWLSGPKVPGLMILEHETSDTTVDGFISSFPQIAAHGWRFQSVARAIGDGRTYLNAANNTSDDVVPMSIGNPAGSSSSSTSTRTSTRTSTPSNTPTNAPTTTIPPSAAPQTDSARRNAWSTTTMALAILAVIVACTS